MLCTVLMTLAPGCFEDDQEEARLAVAPGALQPVERAVDRLADVADAHRGAVAIGYDHVPPGLGGGELIVVVDGERLLVAGDRPFGVVDRGLTDHSSDIFELQVLFDELGGVDLDAHRRLLLAPDRAPAKRRRSG